MPSQIILDAIHILKLTRGLIRNNPRYSSHKRIYPFHKCRNGFDDNCRRCAYIRINRDIEILYNKYK